MFGDFFWSHWCPPPKSKLNEFFRSLLYKYLLSLSLSLSLTFSALSPFAVTPEPIPFPLTHSTHNLTLWTTCIMRNSIRTSTTNLCCRNHATQCLLYITQIPFLSCHPRYTDFSNSQISVLDLVCDLIVTNWKKHPYKFH